MTVAVIAAMQNGKSVADLPEEGYEDMVDVAVKFRRDHGPIVFNFGSCREIPRHGSHRGGVFPRLDAGQEGSQHQLDA